MPIVQYVGTTGLLQRTASLFAKSGQTVHVEVVEDAGTLRLMVSGPAAARRSVEFADEAALRSFQRNLERELAEDGFTLIASAERRAGVERRRFRRGPDRRRS